MVRLNHGWGHDSGAVTVFTTGVIRSCSKILTGRVPGMGGVPIRVDVLAGARDQVQAGRVQPWWVWQ